MIHVSIIDDHALFRSCLSEYLAKQKDISVEFDEGDPNKILDKLGSYKIDITLVDLFMPKVSGDSLIKSIKEKYPHIKIIILSMCTELPQISSLIDQGIHSYISKADDIGELVSAIYAVHDNKIYKNKLFTDALYWHNLQASEKKTNGSHIQFDDREKRILQLLWEEKSNKEIAQELFIGIRSIEKIRQHMKEKLGVKTTIGLLKYALTSDIIPESRKDESIASKKILNPVHG